MSTKIVLGLRIAECGLRIRSLAGRVADRAKGLTRNPQSAIRSLVGGQMATPAQSHCIFCDIIKGAAEVSVCYEDTESIAFMDIQPVNAGHVLVVSRQHFESFLDLPKSLGAHLFEVAMQLAPAIRKVSGADGMNVIVSSGAAAGQDVYHFHIHLIPRRQGDGFDVRLPFAESEMPDRTVLDMMAARIIGALRDPTRTRGAAREAAAVP